MRKVIATVLFVLVLLFVFLSCAGGPSADELAAQEEARQAAEKARRDSLEIEVQKSLSFGMEYYKNGQYADAIPHFKRIIYELNPDEERAWKYLADSYFRMNMPDSAFGVYRNGIAKFPENAYLHRGLGILFQQNTMLDSAMAEYMKAFEFDPKDAFSATQIGRLYLSLAKLDTALLWFETSVKADSNNVEIWEKLADLYMVRGNWEGVKEAYQNLHRINPENADYILNLGRATANTGDYETAITTLNKYIKNNPEDFKGYQYMALIYVADSKFNDALESFKKAEELAPENVKLLLDIADTYVEMKRFDSAARYLNKARNVEPNSCQAIVTEGNICTGRARAAVPTEGIGIREKLSFQCCYDIYKRALRSDCERWADVARVKMDYLKQYLPTDQERKEFFFIHPELEGKICD